MYLRLALEDRGGALVALDGDRGAPAAVVQLRRRESDLLHLEDGADLSGSGWIT